ncbi:hypothetical protein LCGC14_1055070 [marine sediment metagenome]|uniref:Uncharacterized protein n=1 Tax=marine sediment metagenome TaxID=412755 RepID=A0A0F9Q5T3_9ZZZZ
MKKYLEPLIHVLVWGIGYFLILNYTSTIGDFRKDRGPYWVALFFGMLMNQTVFYTTAFFLVPKFLRLKKIKALIFSILSVIPASMDNSGIKFNDFLDFIMLA